MPPEHIHFVTGRLAERSLRSIVEKLSPAAGFEYSISVLPITVAALMTPQWIARRLSVPAGVTRLLVPGYCQGDLQPLRELAPGAAVERGPKDLRELPEFFGQEKPADYGAYDIQILAEINHAPRLPLAEILAQAEALRGDGADLIDLGCNPGETWAGVADCVRALRDAGHRVSIDSYDVAEIEPAVRAGAELVLSVNATNRERAPDWGCEVVVVPDDTTALTGLDESIEFLAEAGVPLRIDAILSPIAFGFAESLGRYLEARRRWPEAEMMMGIGNLTELTDADSAAINVLLLGFCQELGIRSVLTTQVINWARSSVRECDLARRLTYHAVAHRTLPKRLDPRLLLLRDPKLLRHGPDALAELAGSVKDHNYRIFAEDGLLHLISAGIHLTGQDPFDISQQLEARRPTNLDASHAFYLGYEMAKAVTALTLGKNYRQDDALDWGFLTRPEVSHRARKAAAEAASVASSKAAGAAPPSTASDSSTPADSAPAALADSPVVITLPVQWGDQDALGHVNNIVYFRWCESARIEYLRRLGLDAAGTGQSAGVIVAAIGCDFRRPVTFPDTVQVGARITRIGRSSMAMEHKVYSQAQQAVVAEATSTIVAFDHRAGGPRPVADDVRVAIGRLEGKPL